MGHNEDRKSAKVYKEGEIQRIFVIKKKERRFSMFCRKIRQPTECRKKKEETNFVKKKPHDHHICPV